MNADYRQRVIMHEDFDHAMEEMREALSAEGMQTIAHTDLRERFRETLGHDWHDLRRCELVEAWAPYPALHAYERDPDAEALLPASFVVAELANGETAVTASEPLSWMQWHPRLRRTAPGLVAFAADQEAHVAHVMARLDHTPTTVGRRLAAA